MEPGDHPWLESASGHQIPGVPQSPHPSLLRGPQIQPPPHPPTQASTAEKAPEKSSPRAPTTSINKDSQGAGPSPRHGLGKAAGSGAGAQRPERGEKEEEEKEEKEEGRRRKGRGGRGEGAGPQTPRTGGHARRARRRGALGQPRTGEEGAVPARWASAARPLSRSWRRRRTWFTAAWRARALWAEGGEAPGRSEAGGRGGRRDFPTRSRHRAGSRPPCPPFRERNTLKRPRRFPRAHSGVPGSGPRRRRSCGGGFSESRLPEPIGRSALTPSERLTSELSRGEREGGNLGWGWED